MANTPDPALLEQLRTALASSYEIESELGGGMSRVFLANERSLGRRVVIKVLPPELTAGVNRDRFRREIQFAARLQHPHIVPLLTAGQVGDILYYTMPLVEGETLRARLERERRLQPAAVMAILQDVVDALAYAHGQGLVHRDIKPENILLQRHHALITDFGVAKAINDALPGSPSTTVGVAVGTPAYMAPEQLAADPAADHRIDLYAVGLLAYELLSGASPFKGSSPQQTLARQMTERPTPPHLAHAEVPPALSAVVMRCLEKDPAARWASADALLQALSEIRITASGMRAVTRRLGLPAVAPRSRTLRWGGALVLLLVLAAAGYAVWGGSRAGGTPAGGDSTPVAPAAGDALKSDTLRNAMLLTRADSEAIAAAVARRITQRRPAPKPPAAATISVAALDSIRSAVERSVTDSVMRMLGEAQRSLQKIAPQVGLLVPEPPRGPAGGTPAQGSRGPVRLVVLDIVDVSRERSLAELTSQLSDSLVRALRRVPGALVVSGGRVGELERQFGNDQVLGMSLNAEAVLRGSLAPRRDSVTLFIALFDVREQRYVRSFRRTALRSEAAALPGALVGSIREWLASPRAGAGRALPGVRVFPDSALRMFRDSLRRRGVPPAPQPNPPPSS